MSRPESGDRKYRRTDPRVFSDFFLRNDNTITRLIEETPYRMVIFKPLKDSYRVEDLLASIPVARPYGLIGIMRTELIRL